LITAGTPCAYGVESRLRGEETRHQSVSMEATLKVTGLFNNAQRTVNVAAGSEVFRQGDTGEEMYGIVSGEIELRVNDHVVRTLGADDIFGEMAIVESEPRSATALATKDSVLAVINRHRFLFLVQETPMFALQVMSAMAERQRADD
jgi:CRP/FNR family transcriptional regulator, cyclic AMP receptor protein